MTGTTIDTVTYQKPYSRSISLLVDGLTQTESDNGGNFSKHIKMVNEVLTDASITYWNDGLEKVILSFMDLKYNWDGYNAEPISHQIMNNANYILSTIPNKYLNGLEGANITPVANGTISMEWEAANGSYLIVNIGKDYATAIYKTHFGHKKTIPKLYLANIGKDFLPLLDAFYVENTNIQ